MGRICWAGLVCRPTTGYRPTGHACANAECDSATDESFHTAEFRLTKREWLAESFRRDPDHTIVWEENSCKENFDNKDEEYSSTAQENRECGLQNRFSCESILCGSRQSFRRGFL
jgi:hypothetical protein